MGERFIILEHQDLTTLITQPMLLGIRAGILIQQSRSGNYRKDAGMKQEATNHILFVVALGAGRMLRGQKR